LVGNKINSNNLEADYLVSNNNNLTLEVDCLVDKLSHLAEDSLVGKWLSQQVLVVCLELEDNLHSQQEVVYLERNLLSQLVDYLELNLNQVEEGSLVHNLLNLREVDYLEMQHLLSHKDYLVRILQQVEDSLDLLPQNQLHQGDFLEELELQHLWVEAFLVKSQLQVVVVFLVVLLPFKEVVVSSEQHLPNQWVVVSSEPNPNLLE
jgi:hypothetical protein